MNWKLINTAPKDGSKIFLGYSSDDRSKCFYENDCAWQRGQWCVWEINGFDTMGWCPVNFTPNCWHPMPNDPPPNIEGVKHIPNGACDHMRRVAECPICCAAREKS